MMKSRLSKLFVKEHSKKEDYTSTSEDDSSLEDHGKEKKVFNEDCVEVIVDTREEDSTVRPTGIRRRSLTPIRRRSSTPTRSRSGSRTRRLIARKSNQRKDTVHTSLSRPKDILVFVAPEEISGDTPIPCEIISPTTGTRSDNKPDEDGCGGHVAHKIFAEAKNTLGSEIPEKDDIEVTVETHESTVNPREATGRKKLTFGRQKRSQKNHKEHIVDTTSSKPKDEIVNIGSERLVSKGTPSEVSLAERRSRSDIHRGSFYDPSFNSITKGRNTPAFEVTVETHESTVKPCDDSGRKRLTFRRQKLSKENDQEYAVEVSSSKPKEEIVEIGPEKVVSGQMSSDITLTERRSRSYIHRGSSKVPSSKSIAKGRNTPAFEVTVENHESTVKPSDESGNNKGSLRRGRKPKQNNNDHCVDGSASKSKKETFSTGPEKEVAKCTPSEINLTERRSRSWMHRGGFPIPSSNSISIGRNTPAFEVTVETHESTIKSKDKVKKNTAKAAKPQLHKKSSSNQKMKKRNKKAADVLVSTNPKTGVKKVGHEKDVLRMGLRRQTHCKTRVKSPARKPKKT